MNGAQNRDTEILFGEYVLRLKPESGHSINGSTARSVHAFLLNVIGLSDPSAARRLHGWKGSKPFTVSRLIGKIEKEDSNLIISKDQVYTVRITCYEEAANRAIIRTLSNFFGNKEPVELWGERFYIEEFLVASLRSYPPVLGGGDLEEKVNEFLDPENNHSVLIKFFSPTAFKKNDKLYLFPDSLSVFKSLYQKSAHYKNKLGLTEEFPEEAADAIVVDRYRLSTSVVKWGDIAIPGFKGEAVYDMKRLGKEERKLFFKLSFLANYTGVGIKTTQGMGQSVAQPVR